MSNSVTFIGALPKPVSTNYHLDNLVQLHPIVYLNKVGNITDERIARSMKYVEKVIESFGICKFDITFNVTIDEMYINIEPTITFITEGPTAYSLIASSELISPFDITYKKFMYGGHTFHISETIPDYAMCVDNLVESTPMDAELSFPKQLLVSTVLFGKKDISLPNELTSEMYSNVTEYIELLDNTVYTDLKHFVHYELKSLPNRMILTAYVQSIPYGLSLYDIIKSPIYEVNDNLYKTTHIDNLSVSVSCRKPNTAILAKYILYNNQRDITNRDTFPVSCLVYRIYRSCGTYIISDLEKPIWM